MEEVNGAGGALSENLNTNNLEFTVHQEGAKEQSFRGTEATKSKNKTQDAAPPNGKVGGKDFVNATLTAWNQCPGIVKKQLDTQFEEIKSLKEQLKGATVRLN